MFVHELLVRRQMRKRALHASDTALAKWERGTSTPAPGSVAIIEWLADSLLASRSLGVRNWPQDTVGRGECSTT
jgi:hypothetical protein